jgi:NTE family protein
MKYITWFLTFLFSTGLFAQNPDSLFRRIQNPKVGVVLSGGGAKGLAHIGVLKVLEQEGVKIDFIGGTSMGAMVGGLYAAGYSANQLDSIFRVIDFDEVIQDNLPRRVKSFFEKENDEKYSVTFPFYKMKFGIPIAFSKGQNTYNCLFLSCV